MEITRQQSGDLVEIKVVGRLDSYWADDLLKSLEEAIREGTHHIRLNLSATTFLSSAGIRVLMTVYKQLKGINGSFAVCAPSEAVQKVLSLSGLVGLLAAESQPADGAAAKRTEPKRSGASQLVQLLDAGGATFEVFEQSPTASLRCRTIGCPSLLGSCGFHKDHCTGMVFPDSAFGLGLGALGHDFEDCQKRFGEFLAAAGAAAYLPTDGTNVADYLVASGDHLPDVQVCYALACEGAFSKLARFQIHKEAGALTLTQLAQTCLNISGADRAGIVMVAESAGLMGAALRRSPMNSPPAADVFNHPEIRDWLSFTVEHAFPRSMTLIVGVAAAGDGGPLASWVRPLGRSPGISGHFHAAAFSYRPMPKGVIDLKTTVNALFEGQLLQGVLHLLGDDRAIAGAGESEFIRGACWISAISDVVAERT